MQIYKMLTAKFHIRVRQFLRRHGSTEAEVHLTNAFRIAAQVMCVRSIPLSNQFGYSDGMLLFFSFACLNY